jgi:shikimate dehydrogenase
LISGETRLVGLIGNPVDGSLSPAMQNAAFAARGLDWAYVPLLVEAGELEDAVRGLLALGFAGANVTAPYKLDVARLVRASEPSVNTLVVRAGRIEAYSTDAAVLGDRSPERPVVLGGGGAAAAFVRALPGARQFSRSGDWPADVAGADLVVNATSERDEVLVTLGCGQTLVDLPYPETATARAAREEGAEVISGLDALVAQGAASFELWTGLPAPVEVMRRALGLRS